MEETWVVRKDTLTDGPSFSGHCGKMELNSSNLSNMTSQKKAALIRRRSIWRSLVVVSKSGCLFIPVSALPQSLKTLLSCFPCPSGPPVAINLALWKSNFCTLRGPGIFYSFVHFISDIKTRYIVTPQKTRLSDYHCPLYVRVC